MKRSVRLLLIGRHFWPHGSIDSASALTEFACAVGRQSVDVEVVAPRYATSWPEEIVVREIPVHRPSVAPRNDWTVGRYVRHLTNYLRTHASSFDVMMVDSIREESMAAIEASRSTGRPVILRCSGWGDQRDPNWWALSRAARRCGTMGRMADAVIAKSAVCQRALVSDGYDAKKVHRIDNGFPSQPTRTTQTRLDARRSLGLMNSDLAAEADAPVLLCVSRMTRSSGMNQLVGAARHLIAKFPDLRIWLVGDGPHRDWMYEQLRGDGVRASIAMPGSFCDMDEVFAAADLYLQSDDSGLDSFLPKAISNELPVVTVDTESTRSVIVGSTTTEPSTGSTPTAESLVHWCPGATPKNFRIGITSILNDLTSAQEKASELRRIAVRSRPLQNCVADHVNLMQRLIEQNSPPKNGSSREALS